MLLPMNLREITKDSFPQFCAILARTTSLQSSEPVNDLEREELNETSQLFFELLYALYPHNLLNYARMLPETLAKSFQSRFVKVTFHPKLLDNSPPESEFLNERWKNSDVTKELFTFISQHVRSRKSPIEDLPDHAMCSLYDFMQKTAADLNQFPEQGNTSRVLSDNVKHLQEQIIVLKARLFYEQYIQRLFADRMALFNQDVDDMRRTKERLVDMVPSLAHVFKSNNSRN